jgi:hypothetical protein
MQFVAGDVFLSSELLVDEFARNLDSNPGLTGKSLRTSKPSI